MLGEDAQASIAGLIVFLIALGFIIAGVVVVSGGAVGLGLILIGVGSIVGGFGGTLSGGYGLLKIAGTAGFVLIVIGAIIRLITGK